MPISNGQQWCDFTTMYWILKYLQHSLGVHFTFGTRKMVEKW